MTTRKSKPEETLDGFVLDDRAFDIPLPETTPSIEDLLRGTPSERREALVTIGFMLKSRHSLPAHLAEVLGDALIAIGDGTSAAEALGLSLKPGKEKTYGVRYAKIIEYLVSDLCRQGMSRDDAWSRVARLNRERGEFINDPDKKAVDRLKRRLKRGRTK